MRKAKLFFIAFIAISMLVSCGSNDNDNGISGSYTYGGTTSPGDVWEFVINHDDNTFTGSYLESGKEFQIGGTFELLPSGFYKATITSIENTSNSSDVPSVGDQAYFLEIPGLALAVHPIEEHSTTIVMVNKSSCDDVAGDYNYIRAAFYDSSEKDEYGEAAISGTSTLSLNVTMKHVLSSSTNNESMTGSCENGKVTINSSGGSVTGYASSGGMVLDFGENEGGVIGFKKNDLTLDTVGNKTYVGLLFQVRDTDSDNDLDTEEERPVKAEMSNNTGHGYELNVETNEVDESEGVTITFNSINNGLIDATITDSQGSYNTKIAAYEKDGKIILAGLHIDSYGSPNVFVLASQ